MKRIVIAMAVLASMASAFCEYGRKVDQSYNGGHIQAVYDFGQGRVLTFNFPYGTSIPYQMRYDFWKGAVCY